MDVLQRQTVALFSAIPPIGRQLTLSQKLYWFLKWYCQSIAIKAPRARERKYGWIYLLVISSQTSIVFQSEQWWGRMRASHTRNRHYRTVSVWFCPYQISRLKVSWWTTCLIPMRCFYQLLQTCLCEDEVFFYRGAPNKIRCDGAK